LNRADWRPWIAGAPASTASTTACCTQNKDREDERTKDKIATILAA
jgi:hypothetical protein